MDLRRKGSAATYLVKSNINVDAHVKTVGLQFIFCWKMGDFIFFLHKGYQGCCVLYHLYFSSFKEIEPDAFLCKGI